MSENAPHKPYASQHATGRERYLTQVMEYSLAQGWVTPDDFLRRFPPRTLVTSLAEQEELRVELLVKVGKVHEKLAAKKSIESAGEDLEIAVSEGLCEPQDVLDVFKPDDRVSYLPAGELWSFATDGEFYNVGAIDPDYERVLARIVFMIEQALAEGLITLEDVGDALTFDEIATLMPIERLQDVVRHSLKEGRLGNPLTEQSLLTVVPMSELLGFFDLEQVWKRAIIGKVAAPQSFVGEAAAAEARAAAAKAAAALAASPKSIPPAARSAPAAKAQAAAPKAAPAPAAPAPKPTRSVPPPPPPEPPPARAPASAPAEGAASEGDDPREQVMARLREVGRLPPAAATLPVPVLLSIDSMYAELDYAETDDDREELIRESFPNQAYLRQAMLALIELLDPGIDTKDALIKDAEIDSLIKIVLFEERRRR